MKLKLFLLASGLVFGLVLFQNCGTRTGSKAFKATSSSTTPDVYSPSDTPILTPDAPVLPPPPETPDPVVVPPIVTASTEWGTSHNEEIYGVSPVDGNDDGVIDGYISVGFRNATAQSTDYDSKDILFSKYGESGKHLFTVKIGKSNVADTAFKAVELPESYLVVGTTVVQTGGSDDRDILLLKINKTNGSVEFARRISGPRNEVILDAQLVDIGGDLNIIAVGYATNRSDSKKQVGIFIRFDLNFNIEASNHYSNSSHKIRLRELGARGNNVFAVGLTVDKATEEQHRAIILKLNADGGLLAAKRAGSSKMTHFTGLRVPAGKSFLVASGVHTDGAISGALVEFSESLFVNKAFRYGTNDKRETFHGIDIAPGGHIAVTGHYGDGDGQDILVGRLKANYDVIWGRRFGTSKNDTSFHHPISFRLGANKNGVAIAMSPTAEKVSGKNLRDTQVLLLNEDGMIDKANCGGDKGILSLMKTNISGVTFNNITIGTGDTDYTKEAVNLSVFSAQAIPTGQVSKNWCHP